jgi:hypothetical protein
VLLFLKQLFYVLMLPMLALWSFLYFEMLLLRRSLSLLLLLLMMMHCTWSLPSM